MIAKLFRYYIAHHMGECISSKRLQSLEVFNEIDKNKDGQIDVEEMMSYLTSENAESFIRQLDLDKNGKVSFLEFFQASINFEEVSDELINASFNFFDKNNDGFIDLNEVKEHLQNPENYMLALGKENTITREQFKHILINS